MNDPYWDIIEEQWDNILMIYKKFEDKKPIMLFDIQEQRIYACAYEGFKADLSKESQIQLEEVYKKALSNNKIVIFVRDNKKRKLVSYSVELKETESQKLNDALKKKGSQAKKHNMELIKEIEKYLPIPVYPSKELCKLLMRKKIKIDINTELQITKVSDSGEAGGIVCSIMERNGEVIVVSLTHLNIKPDHPLSDKILKYQKDRIKNLSKSK